MTLMDDSTAEEAAFATVPKVKTASNRARPTSANATVRIDFLAEEEDDDDDRSAPLDDDGEGVGRKNGESARDTAVASAMFTPFWRGQRSNFVTPRDSVGWTLARYAPATYARARTFPARRSFDDDESSAVVVVVESSDVDLSGSAHRNSAAAKRRHSAALGRDVKYGREDAIASGRTVGGRSPSPGAPERAMARYEIPSDAANTNGSASASTFPALDDWGFRSTSVANKSLSSSSPSSSVFDPSPPVLLLLLLSIARKLSPSNTSRFNLSNASPGPPTLPSRMAATPMDALHPA
mmetsp:Transcript_32292/g.67713  ORF Transcript_32292/g.67713 Transcript_32292/m.67713 type:complete len:295 (-) Transcript_32292:726-1610(-)